MWRPRDGGSGNIEPREVWQKAIQCTYIEVLAKSLADEFQKTSGLEYWRYVNGIVQALLERTANLQIGFAKFEEGGHDDLYHRWLRLAARLGIEIPI